MPTEPRLILDLDPTTNGRLHLDLWDQLVDRLKKNHILFFGLQSSNSLGTPIRGKEVWDGYEATSELGGESTSQPW